MTFNKLSLQRGDNLHLYRDFYFKHPTLNDIIDLQKDKEDKYSEYLGVLTLDILDIADILWVENKIWYEDIKSDWLFFIERASVDAKEILIYKKDFDGTKTIPEKTLLVNNNISEALNFFVGTNTPYAIYFDKTQNIILVSVHKQSSDIYYFSDEDFVFGQHIYEITRRFLKKINWQDSTTHNVVKGGTKYAKRYILENEYKCRMDDLKKKKQPSVTLDSITSSLIAKGISTTEIWNLPIYLVYNLYYRYMQFENWRSTTNALQNGCLDTKKHPVNWEKINWSKVID